ncbi:MAG TPA: hypothetical protein VIF60_21055 [Burkholderiaceae bacterium]|jgi:hypothetical protein
MLFITILLLQIVVCAALVIYGLFMDVHDVHPVEKLVAMRHRLHHRR